MVSEHTIASINPFHHLLAESLSKDLIYSLSDEVRPPLQDRDDHRLVPN